MMNVRGKISAAVFCGAVLFLLLPLEEGFARGRKEADRTMTVQTEGEMGIQFFLLREGAGTNPKPTDPSPQSAALYHLFQRVEAAGEAVKVSSDRNFSLRLGKQRAFSSGGAEIIRYDAEIQPDRGISYRKTGEVPFEFSIDECFSSGRVRFQAGQRAIILASRSSDVKGDVLMRVKEMRLDRNGIFSGIVEIAEPADR